MLKPLRRTRGLAFNFCERCTLVCDAAFRRNAIVARVCDQALLHGIRDS